MQIKSEKSAPKDAFSHSFGFAAFRVVWVFSIYLLPCDGINLVSAEDVDDVIYQHFCTLYIVPL